MDKECRLLVIKPSVYLTWWRSANPERPVANRALIQFLAPALFPRRRTFRNYEKKSAYHPIQAKI